MATTVKMMLTFEFGLCISFSGIVIPALRGDSNEHNTDEPLTLTGQEASWIGIQRLFLGSGHKSTYGRMDEWSDKYGDL